MMTEFCGGRGMSMPMHQVGNFLEQWECSTGEALHHTVAALWNGRFSLHYWREYNMTSAPFSGPLIIASFYILNKLKKYHLKMYIIILYEYVRVRIQKRVIRYIQKKLNVNSTIMKWEGK
jgi:hypothetical protein